MSDTFGPAVFWDYAHEDANSRALSGHSLSTHLDVMKLRDFILRCKTVLCIGIGDGVWIQDMLNQFPWLTIECIDISTKAFDCVSAFRCYTPDDFYTLSQVDKYDLIISFWVSPHMTDPQLEQQLQCGIKTLTRKGLFALQYNEPINPDDEELARFISPATTTNIIMSAGLFCRTPSTIHKMVEQADGEVVYKAQNGLVDGGKENEMVMHIARRAS